MFSMMAGLRCKYYSGPVDDIWNRPLPCHGDSGGSLCHGNRTMPDVSGLSAPVLAQTDSGKGTARIFKKGGDIDRQIMTESVYRLL